MTDAPADSIFSRIIRGEIPASRIYEDAAVIAFMDVAPLARGHVLVVPKEPAETIDRLSDDAAASLGRVLPRITRAVMQATGAAAVNILQNNGPAAGQEVMHVHVHVIPRFPDLDGEPAGGEPGGVKPGGGGLRKQWTPMEQDAEERAELGRQIARLL